MKKYDYVVDERLDNERRDKIVIIRMTTNEHEMCKKKAYLRQRSMSEYVRCLVYRDNLKDKLL